MLKLIWNRIRSFWYISVHVLLRNYPRLKILNPREKISGPRNTHEKKNWTHKISTRKNTKSTKYPQENILEPRNTHEKKFGTPEISTRKYFGSTKYPRRHNGTRPKKTKMACDPRNLAHSIVILSSLLCLLSKSY